MRKIHVITGGPETGKTTLCNILKLEHEYQVIPEAGRILKNQNIHPEQDFKVFQEKAVEIQTKNEDEQLSFAKRPIFTDRSIVDGLAYCRAFDQPVPDVLANKAEEVTTQKRYHGTVLLLDRVHSKELDPLRTESPEMKERVHSCIRDIYQEQGFEVAEISVVKPYQRTMNALYAALSRGKSWNNYAFHYTEQESIDATIEYLSAGIDYIDSPLVQSFHGQYLTSTALRVMKRQLRTDMEALASFQDSWGAGGTIKGVKNDHPYGYGDEERGHVLIKAKSKTKSIEYRVQVGNAREKDYLERKILDSQKVQILDRIEARPYTTNSIQIEHAELPRLQPNHLQA